MTAPLSADACALRDAFTRLHETGEPPTFGNATSSLAWRNLADWTRALAALAELEDAGAIVMIEEGEDVP